MDYGPSLQLIDCLKQLALYYISFFVCLEDTVSKQRELFVQKLFQWTFPDMIILGTYLLKVATWALGM